LATTEAPAAPASTGTLTTAMNPAYLLGSIDLPVASMAAAPALLQSCAVCERLGLVELLRAAGARVAVATVILNQP
jgi:hypothetical protein